jgi:hypothetical protein
MTLPATGEITTSMINLELGRAANAPFNITGGDERGLAEVPSGQISWSDFYGKSGKQAPTVTGLRLINATNVPPATLPIRNSTKVRFIADVENWYTDGGGSIVWSVSYNGGAFTSANFTGNVGQIVDFVCTSPNTLGGGTLTVKASVTNPQGNTIATQAFAFETIADLDFNGSRTLGGSGSSSDTVGISFTGSSARNGVGAYSAYADAKWLNYISSVALLNLLHDTNRASNYDIKFTALTNLATSNPALNIWGPITVGAGVGGAAINNARSAGVGSTSSLAVGASYQIRNRLNNTEVKSGRIDVLLSY